MAEYNTDPLLLQVSADISKLEKQMARILPVVDAASSSAEKRVKKMSDNINHSVEGINIGKALDSVFDRSRFTLFEEGSTQLRVFGSAIEYLGPAGIAAAVGLGALAIGFERVKKAGEEVEQLNVDAKRLGVSVEGLQELQYAAKESHVPVEALNTSLEGLNDTLGKLRGGAALDKGGRATKLADYLGFTPDELAAYKVPLDILPELAERIKALPSLGEQVAAAQKFGVLPILPILLQGKEGIADLRAEYKALGLEISGETAENIDKGNQALERANTIAHDKLRNSLIELHPLIIALGTAWDGVAAKAVDAINFMVTGLNFANSTKAANTPVTGVGSFFKQQFGALGQLIDKPGVVLSAPFSQSSRDILKYGEGGKPPPTPAEVASAAAPTGPTKAQIEAQVKASTALAKLQAELLDHTSHRLAVEKQIAEIEKEQGHAIDPSVRRRLLAAASAQDAKPGIAANNQALERAKASTDAILKAQEDELTARKALGLTVNDQLEIELASIETDKEKKNADLDSLAAQHKITQGAADIAKLLNEGAAGEKAALAVKQARWKLELQQLQLVADQLNTLAGVADLNHDFESAYKVRLAQIVNAQAMADAQTSQSTSDDDTKQQEYLNHSITANTAILKANGDRQVQISNDALSGLTTENDIRASHLDALEGLAKTTQERREIELQLLKIAQDQKAAELNAIIHSPNSTPQQIGDANAKLAAIPQETADRTDAIFKTTQEAFKQGILGAFEAAKGGAKSLAEYFATSLENKLLDTLADNLASILTNALRNTGGQSGGGGFLGSALNFGASLFGVGHNASGTDNWKGGLTYLNERGPEGVAYLPKGTQVIPNNVMKSLANMKIPQAAGVTVIQPFHFHAEGAVLTQDLLNQANQTAAGFATRAYSRSVADSTAAARQNFTNVQRQDFLLRN